MGSFTVASCSENVISSLLASTSYVLTSGAFKGSLLHPVKSTVPIIVPMKTLCIFTISLPHFPSVYRFSNRHKDSIIPAPILFSFILLMLLFIYLRSLCSLFFFILSFRGLRFIFILYYRFHIS